MCENCQNEKGAEIYMYLSYLELQVIKWNDKGISNRWNKFGKQMGDVLMSFYLYGCLDDGIQKI